MRVGLVIMAMFIVLVRADGGILVALMRRRRRICAVFVQISCEVFFLIVWVGRKIFVEWIAELSLCSCEQEIRSLLLGLFAGFEMEFVKESAMEFVVEPIAEF